MNDDLARLLAALGSATTPPRHGSREPEALDADVGRRALGRPPELTPAQVRAFRRQRADR